MRVICLATVLSLSSLAAWSQPTDPAAPLGKLSDAAKPTAYRVDMTILPDQPRFSGHDEIDAVLKAPTKRLYLHGRDINVSKAVALVEAKPVVATWTQVDKTAPPGWISQASCRPARSRSPSTSTARSGTARRASTAPRSATSGTAGRSSNRSTRAPRSRRSTSRASRRRSRFRSRRRPATRP